MVKVKRAKPSGDNLLKDFAMTFEKGDGMISFGKGIIRLLGLGDDNNFGLAPGVKT